METRNKIAMLVMLGALPGLVASQQAVTKKNYKEVDANKPVICLLPGRVRKVGGLMTYIDPRKPMELTASECAIRGGEYTFYDRANYENALAVWKEAAGQGDPTAQIYVGEIYEKGWTGSPDYAEAARWYAMASNKGDRRAQRRLAYLYENGLGVQRDTDAALDLWRDALGLQEDLVLASEMEAAKSEAERKIGTLVAEVDRLTSRADRLQRSLDSQETTLYAQRTELERVQTERRELARALAEAKTNAADTGRVRELESQLAQRESLVDEQQIAIELLQADIEAQRAQVASSKRQAEVRERQLATAQQALERETTRGDELLQQLEAQNQALASLELQLADSRKSLEQGQTEQQSLEAQLASADDRGSSSSARESQLRRQITDNKKLVAQKQTEVDRLSQTVAEQRAQFEQALASADVRETELGAALAASRKEKEALASKLEAAEGRLDGLDTQLADTRYALADARAESESLQQRVSNIGDEDDAQTRQLVAELDRKQRVIAQQEKAQSDLEARWDALVRDRDGIREDLASESKRRSWLEVELAAANVKFATAKGDLQKMSRAIEDADFEKQRLRQDIARMTQDLELAGNRSGAEQRQIQGQLAATRSRLTQAETEIDDLRRQKARLESDIDVFGRRRENRMLAVRGLMPVAEPVVLPSGVRPGPYRALIIANYDYDYLDDLATPANDANDLKQLLEDQYGFIVDVEINLNRREMFAALNRLKAYSEKESVLVYYAGHGAMDESADGYWLPTDFKNGQPYSDAISSGDITQNLKKSDAKHILLVADSCYSGAMLRNASPVVRSNVSARVKFWLANRSRTVITSGGWEPVLDTGPGAGNNSVFANAFIEVLGSNTGVVYGEALHGQVHNRVLRDAAALGYLDQKPQFAAIEDAGHENGQFVFIRTGA